MPSDDEGSEVESGREQFPKWVQSTFTHHCWCETSKQVSHELSPLLSSMVNWIKQMVPQPVILPPGAVPIERPKKSSRSSLDKGMRQCILICMSHFENCALHIFTVTNILFILLPEFDVVIFWSWNVCISWFSLQFCLRHRNPSAGSLWILTARPQGTFWSRTAVIRQQILLSEDLKVGWKKKGTIWF